MYQSRGTFQGVEATAKDAYSIVASLSLQLNAMKMNVEILNDWFVKFSRFLAEKDGWPFTTIVASSYVERHENYKYTVYEEAGTAWGQKWWKREDIGTGKIQQKVNFAIQTTVLHKGRTVQNNLIDWRKKR